MRPFRAVLEDQVGEVHFVFETLRPLSSLDIFEQQNNLMEAHSLE